MKASEALRAAIREVADPACRRCHGSGATGRDLMRDLCGCVEQRVPHDDETSQSPRADAGGPSGEELPHLWGFITRRAEHIQARARLGSAPGRWR